MSAVQPFRSDQNASSSRNPGNDPSRHTITRGETLDQLATCYGVSIDALLQANPQIRNPDVIYAGDTLAIPGGGGRSYTVRSGDTLEAIARTHGSSVAALADTNNIRNPDLIYPGDRLLIPGATPPAGTPAPEVSSPPLPPPVETTPGSPVVGETPPVANDGAFDYNGIVGVRGNPNVTPAFIAEVEAMAQRLDARPEHLLAVMSFETGGTFDPGQRNLAGSGATGLIQFMPATARGLGTSTDALAQMTPVQQLRYVEAYFDQYPGRLNTLEGVYTSVLSGRATPNPADTLRTPSGREFVQGNAEYSQNAGLDFNRDGRITSGEATQAVAARLYGGVSAVQQRLVDAGAVPEAQHEGFVDGEFGRNTAAAVRAYQAANGLPQTGLLDDATGRALFDLGGSGDPPPVSGTPGGLPQERLARGDSGNNVAALQDSLVGFGLISADTVAGGRGTFGPATESAVKAFQSATSLSPSGVYDNATRAAMTAVNGGVGIDHNANADVTRGLQEKLVDLDFLTQANADAEAGRFGPQTEAALKAFQAENGVAQTGILGATTFAALQRAGGGDSWPVPGRFEINRADRPGEGDGEFGDYVPVAAPTRASTSMARSATASSRSPPVRWSSVA